MKWNQLENKRISKISKVLMIILLILLPCELYLNMSILSSLSFVLIIALSIIYSVTKSNSFNSFGFKEIKFDEMFDLNGEPAIIELHEHIDPATRVSHYVAVLVMIGRDKLKFSQEEINTRKLKTVDFETWNRFR